MSPLVMRDLAGIGLMVALVLLTFAALYVTRR